MDTGDPVRQVQGTPPHERVVALGLDEAGSRALFDALHEMFTGAGFALAYGAPLRWYVPDGTLEHNSATVTHTGGSSTQANDVVVHQLKIEIGSGNNLKRRSYCGLELPRSTDVWATRSLSYLWSESLRAGPRGGHSKRPWSRRLRISNESLHCRRPSPQTGRQLSAVGACSCGTTIGPSDQRRLSYEQSGISSVQSFLREETT